MNPFDLPVHPAVVHFPIAMLSAAWACILLRHATGTIRWSERARLFEVVGVFALPLAIAAGFVDLRGLGTLTDTRWDQPLIWHVVTALAGSGLFAAHAVMTRPATIVAGPARVVDLGLSTVALWLIVVAGLLASEMVYAA